MEIKTQYTLTAKELKQAVVSWLKNEGVLSFDLYAEDIDLEAFKVPVSWNAEAGTYPYSEGMVVKTKKTEGSF